MNEWIVKWINEWMNEDKNNVYLIKLISERRKTYIKWVDEGTSLEDSGTETIKAILMNLYFTNLPSGRVNWSFMHFFYWCFQAKNLINQMLTANPAKRIREGASPNTNISDNSDAE